MAPQPFLDCLSKFQSALTDSRPLGVAVSGGSDSLGLLYGLARLIAPAKLVALTVDHGLRAGSTDEARWVKSQCRRLGVCHETLKWEGGAPATGLQAAARAARYRLLAEASARHGLAAVLTAHTRDDQDETLTMRRARSPSQTAPGLAGIPPATLFDGRMWVLRPLLDMRREEIRDHLRSAGAGWVEDPSNTDARFERVRVRTMLKDKPPLASDADDVAIAAIRARLAGKAAEFVDAACHGDANDMIWMRFSPDDDREVVLVVLEALIDLCGGASRPLDRRGKATLADFVTGIAGGDGGRALSLGRTLIRRQGAHLTIRRERRGVESLVLLPGASGVWDGRYRIRNLSKGPVLSVSGGGDAGVLPSFSRDFEGWSDSWTMEEGIAGGFICRRLAGRSSHILPVHELPLAQALARLAQTSRFPACPWGFSTDSSALTAMKVQ